MNTEHIKALNEWGAKTSIHCDKASGKFLVLTEAKIANGAFVDGLCEHFCDTVEEAVEAFNKEIEGKVLTIKSSIEGVGRYMEIPISGGERENCNGCKHNLTVNGARYCFQPLEMPLAVDQTVRCKEYKR